MGRWEYKIMEGVPELTRKWLMIENTAELLHYGELEMIKSETMKKRFVPKEEWRLAVSKI